MSQHRAQQLPLGGLLGERIEKSMVIYSSNQPGKQEGSNSVNVSPERLAAVTVPPSRSSKQRRESVSDQISNAVGASLKHHKVNSTAMELPTLASQSAAASVA